MILSIRKEIVKIMFLSFLLNASSFGCDADCVACHPKLIKTGKMDQTHAILNRCINCHTKNPNEEEHGTCGADCFSCHPIENIKPANIKEHTVLKDCIECHKSLDKSLFELPSNKKSSNSFLQEKLGQ